MSKMKKVLVLENGNIVSTNHWAFRDGGVWVIRPIGSEGIHATIRISKKEEKRTLPKILLLFDKLKGT